MTTNTATRGIVRSKRRLRIHIRWMIRRDTPEVLEIERLGAADPWSEDEIVALLRQRNFIGMVAANTLSDRVLGYMVYELHRTRIELVRLVVHPDARRRGVGTAMVDRLKAKMSQNRRTSWCCLVSERQLDVQLFLRANGLVCDHVGYLNGTDECLLHFLWRWEWGVEA